MSKRDRGLGAYIGAAIGDAMGGPVECQHYARIKRVYGRITKFLPYKSPPNVMVPHQGYALHEDAGSITDDTYIRADLTRFYLDTGPPRTPESLGRWMLANADFTMWWPPAIKALKRVERGEVSAAEGGMTHRQGGGVGWWTPVGILHAGDPAAAAAEAKDLCVIWKAPLEQDILSAVQAAVAEGMKEESTFESMVEAMLKASGPLACALLERGIAVGREARDFDDLADRLYNTCLLDDAPTAADAPLPAVQVPLDDSDEKYTSALLSEQIPLAIAAFVFSKGDARESILNTVMLGRDCDTTATTVASWVGALHGESGLPSDWVEIVCDVNRRDVPIRDLAERIVALQA